MRFAIITTRQKGKRSLAHEWSESLVLEYLLAAVGDQLLDHGSLKEHYSPDEIGRAIKKSWERICRDFKKETVRIK